MCCAKLSVFFGWEESAKFLELNSLYAVVSTKVKFVGVDLLKIVLLYPFIN